MMDKLVEYRGSGAAVSRHAVRDRENVWSEVLRQGEAVEAMFVMAVQVFCEGRLDLIEEIKGRERMIDGWEVRIERECFRVLALYEPVACDLRRLGAALRINSDLERISNLARNIAKRSKKILADSEALPIPAALGAMAQGALGHVRRSLAVMKADDALEARVVIQGDQDVDTAYRVALEDLKEGTRRSPERLDTWLRLFTTARNFERAADHATNIARSVVYIREGDIVRHVGNDVADEL